MTSPSEPGPVTTSLVLPLTRDSDSSYTYDLASLWEDSKWLPDKSVIEYVCAVLL